MVSTLWEFIKIVFMATLSVITLGILIIAMLLAAKIIWELLNGK